MIESLTKRRKIAENDEWTLYTDDMTERLTKDLHKCDGNGFSLQGYKVVTAENRKDPNQSVEFLVLDDKGRPFMDANSLIEFELKLKLVYSDMKEDCNIVNIAQTGYIPKNSRRA